MFFQLWWLLLVPLLISAQMLQYSQIWIFLLKTTCHQVLNADSAIIDFSSLSIEASVWAHTRLTRTSLKSDSLSERRTAHFRNVILWR